MFVVLSVSLDVYNLEGRSTTIPLSTILMPIKYLLVRGPDKDVQANLIYWDFEFWNIVNLLKLLPEFFVVYCKFLKGKEKQLLLSFVSTRRDNPTIQNCLMYFINFPQEWVVKPLYTLKIFWQTAFLILHRNFFCKANVIEKFDSS